LGRTSATGHGKTGAPEKAIARGDAGHHPQRPYGRLQPSAAQDKYALARSREARRHRTDHMKAPYPSGYLHSGASCHHGPRASFAPIASDGTVPNHPSGGDLLAEACMALGWTRRCAMRSRPYVDR
jgi:hypothetical protein